MYKTEHSGIFIDFVTQTLDFLQHVLHFNHM